MPSGPVTHINELLMVLDGLLGGGVSATSRFASTAKFIAYFPGSENSNITYNTQHCITGGKEKLPVCDTVCV